MSTHEDAEPLRVGSWNLKRISEVLLQVRSFVVTLTVFAVVVALTAIVVRQLLSRSFVVDPIKAPASLAQRGYTPEVIAQWIVDEMHNIQTLATTQMTRSVLIPDWDRLNVEMPGSGLSVQTIGSILREGLGIVEQRISGEIAQFEDGYRMRLRLTLDNGDRHAIEVEGDVDQLLEEGAREAIKAIKPFMLASYYYAIASNAELGGVDGEEKAAFIEKMDEMIAVCLENSSREDDSWAHNLRGIALAKQEEHDQAIESYKHAIAADPHFALAEWNWGNSLQEMGRFGEAIRKYRNALGKNRKLDTELPSLMLVDGGNELVGQLKVDKAIDAFQEALRWNPRQAEAYLAWGDVLEYLASTSDSVNKTDTYRQAIEKYRRATEIRPDHVIAHYRWSQALKAIKDPTASERCRKALEIQMARGKADQMPFDFWCASPSGAEGTR